MLQPEDIHVMFYNDKLYIIRKFETEGGLISWKTKVLQKDVSKEEIQKVLEELEILTDEVKEMIHFNERNERYSLWQRIIRKIKAWIKYQKEYWTWWKKIIYFREYRKFRKWQREAPCMC